MSSQIDRLALIVWDYQHVNHKLQKADCIIVLGSHDTRTAERGAELFLEGWAPLLVFSGGRGRLTPKNWDIPEAEMFAGVALKMGVPKEKILIENKSTNTGENVVFTKKFLEEKGLKPRKVIVVQKPYMERRAYATFKKMWPEPDIIVTSPQIPFEKYPNSEISKDDIINIMVGDLQRIKIYSDMGFQISQEIPEDVWGAYKKLVEFGYTKQLIM
ncbi:MAG: hypothetical protein A3F26_02075 [Candidatus Ryanbacteria bacterium RIFCSPHIGHO2_12_FULL_47_12b]|uniref:DUF218 domain-containing protein n=2 Tax=Candidatus Ryaniibacteriota TaxID=1817914 RepID=A0A1G2H564_9BACT|nr:MAG: hypothetical protein UX74_C0007G0008 [Parcubacteria group bacterium GW2011_GWA2_47_10b]OGZ52241.1 MAG: hypothetical protein A3F26_02075 [Candidatus Ryanbacteria bacterium RIFCSPHIGHO2_12_FULL_47_12b]OGZ56110.1 MAG: hypothetical protein A3J04_02505 [Candidatus Ryanbacteria bacterium RIFCSPLOWO2_02_FULL_47_14]OGZ57607.1 MAG: hypothetical protein A3G60_00095 [Candidatus Ryanbacteria bacterium RIFCSPLOWO2_12_FULL_47_9c]